MIYTEEELDYFEHLSYEQRFLWLIEAQEFLQEAYRSNPIIREFHDAYSEIDKK